MSTYLRAGFTAALLTAGAFASGLPPLTSTSYDFTYDSQPFFTTTYNPAGAVTNFLVNTVLLYGTPTGGGGQAVLELTEIGSGDVCYSTTCPSTTNLYPSPNYVIPNIAGFVFDPNSVVAGTGITSILTSFPLSGDMLPQVPPGPTYSVNASGSPTLFIGQDPGGLTSYAYFVNADGTQTNVLHVTNNTGGGAILEGVLLDPPGSLTLDIVGFLDPSGTATVTAQMPEPGSGTLLFAGMLLLAGGLLRKAVSPRLL